MTINFLSLQHFTPHLTLILNYNLHNIGYRIDIQINITQNTLSVHLFIYDYKAKKNDSAAIAHNGRVSDPYIDGAASLEGEEVGGAVALGVAVDVVNTSVAPTYSTVTFSTVIIASFSGGPPVQPGLASVLERVSLDVWASM